MDTASQERFNQIVAQEPAALSEPDIVFLRARRSYLSGEQLKRFEDVLEVEDASSRGEKPISKMNFEELKAKATELGVPIDGLNSKKEVVAAIEAKQAEQSQAAQQ